jgi:hypothetical protein
MGVNNAMAGEEMLAPNPPKIRSKSPVLIPVGKFTVALVPVDVSPPFAVAATTGKGEAPATASPLTVLTLAFAIPWYVFISAAAMPLYVLSVMRA